MGWGAHGHGPRVWRVVIRALGVDPRERALLDDARALGITGVDAIRRADLVFIRGDLDDRVRARLLDELLVDSLLQSAVIDDAPAPERGVRIVETALHAGVTDPVAAEIMRAAALLDIKLDGAATGRRYDIEGSALSNGAMNRLARRLLANPVVEHWSLGEVTPSFADGSDANAPVDIVAIRDLEGSGLRKLNRERGLALDLEELRTIQRWFTSAGRDPTDVELETLAQTWSEHCAHKTFRAEITLDGGERVDTLLDQLRAATASIGAPWVRSAFVGNAGIVDFDGDLIAVKAETHNHPSAVEPFGGANTGVGGVIRDVLGVFARPIATTDVLCFGPADLDPAALPEGVLHPRRVRSGVVAGVADYGNKIGLPTVAGAVLYDPGFTANPLVFCGCIGRLPTDRADTNQPHVGDRIVVIGGRTGRDGIHGATFSSMAMDATTGDIAGASVQIGDPIVEKLLIELLTDAGHLATAITDCGAGGLSSAVGEMAAGIGADVELALVPLKYQGLAPWEIWLSEAQERMVLSVPDVGPLAELCARRGVEWSDIGSFTGDGRLIVRHRGHVVADLDIDFLHDGRPQRHLTGERQRPSTNELTRPLPSDANSVLLALLSHPNIASKARIIRRYDHEILGSSVVRPLTGARADGPGDGVVLAEPRSKSGIAIGIGVNAWYGEHDAARMAEAVVDEAIRNAVVAGADPDRIALLDNFSWGDPTRPATLGSLVAAVEGCARAAITHGAPFVSGKDSLNNEYLGFDGERHAVPPTLVITAVGHVPDASAVSSPDIKAAGDRLYLLGRSLAEFAGSHFDLVAGTDTGAGCVPAADPDAPTRYRQLHRALRSGLVRAAHDASEGGLAVTLSEMAIGGLLGVEVYLDTIASDYATALFSESAGRVVVEVASEDAQAFVSMMEGHAVEIGRVTTAPRIVMHPVIDVDLDAARAAFIGDDA
ncbi:MAG: phosphoribosylformylglycinamidine synthase subunit PurL [Acidimicrobiales bacterium]